MYSYWFENNNSVVFSGQAKTQKEIFSVMDQYKKSIGITNTCFRLWNEKHRGKMMSCIDFGSYSEFMYIYPALNLLEELNQ